MDGENHLTTTAGGSVASDVIWDPQVPSSLPVTPVLQLADGSYVGQVNTFGGLSMVAFDATGNVKWTVPGDSPNLATADGGIIGSSGVTYDSAGVATGQIALFPTYSWKGAYQFGSVEAVVPDFDLANMATTFAAVSGGNLTGNGFSLRHHTFGLIFCNSGTGGDGQCPSFVQTMNFSYLPGINDSNCATACDFSTNLTCNSNTGHPDWVNALKTQALNAYQAAFNNLPAILSHKNTATTLNGGSNNPPFEHTVYIDGEWFSNEGLGCPHNGFTRSARFSWVFYLSEMCEAQKHLGSYGQSAFFTPPFSDAANFKKLVIAIGKGIGNTAAHETGHQIGFFVGLPGLDCGPGSPNGKTCENGLNSVYEAAEPNDSFFVDSIPAIHWETDDVINLQKYFDCTLQACN